MRNADSDLVTGATLIADRRCRCAEGERRSHWALALAAIVLVMAPWACFAGCPSGYYAETIGVRDKHLGLKLTLKTVCLPNPNVVITQVLSPVTGPTLALWIQESRNSAIGQGQPIPDEIRAELQGYIEDWVMDRARFKVGDSGVANLGRLVNKYGDINAITLDDLIVFHNQDAADSPAIWAHELTHVKQYKAFGVVGFASRYAANYREIENPAYAMGDGYEAWSQQQLVQQREQLERGAEKDSEDQVSIRGPAVAAQSISKYFWVGIAWNNSGQFASWTDNSEQAAQDHALRLCNRNYGNCYSASASVPGDRFMCFSVYRDGNDLYEAHEPDPQVATAEAAQNCRNSGDPGPGCQLIVTACNDSSPARSIFALH